MSWKRDNWQYWKRNHCPLFVVTLVSATYIGKVWLLRTPMCFLTILLWEAVSLIRIQFFFFLLSFFEGSKWILFIYFFCQCHNTDCLTINVIGKSVFTHKHFLLAWFIKKIEMWGKFWYQRVHSALSTDYKVH